MTSTPIALIIFNRPAQTERVFQEIARARPPRLLLIADGPRGDRPGEEALCRRTRAIVERVDWDCEVLRNYADANIGCGRRIATGLQWVFEHVEEAIVLEDDCLPHPTFFRYCDELLAKYRDDERVMHISGDNWRFGGHDSPYSYFFSCYCYSCGWASWRRAFRHYDPDVKAWPLLRDTSWLLEILGDERAVAFWREKFDLALMGVDKADGWDWPWLFACWSQRGLSILPRENLITNIGFSEDATHSKRSDDVRANVPTVEMKFPLEHPPYMVRNDEAERAIIEQFGVSLRPLTLYEDRRRQAAAVLPAPIRTSIASIRSRLLRSRRT